MKIDKADDIQVTKEGIIIHVNEELILITWEVVDDIAEASEPHYHQQMINAMYLLQNKTKIN